MTWRLSTSVGRKESALELLPSCVIAQPCSIERLGSGRIVGSIARIEPLFSTHCSFMTLRLSFHCSLTNSDCETGKVFVCKTCYLVKSTGSSIYTNLVSFDTCGERMRLETSASFCSAAIAMFQYQRMSSLVLQLSVCTEEPEGEPER